jgi:DNA-directed RNA polymerase specialized sigma24 family protein
VDRGEDALRRLLIENPHQGWAVFVDTYTPTLLALIERSGVTDRDDALDVYVRVCERLAADECARLRRYDPSRGALAAWLTLVVRNAVIDWVRSRRGRRRLFDAVRRLDRFDQQVFELYYWRQQRPWEIAEMMSRSTARMVSLDEVLRALDRINDALTSRNRVQLAALLARASRTTSLEEDGRHSKDAIEPRDNPEATLRAREIETAWREALETLPAEEAAIVRMIFVHGWTLREVKRGLHLEHLSPERVQGILDKLRTMMARKGIGPGDSARRGLTFLEGTIV